MEVIWLTEAREQMRAVYAYGKAVFGRKVAMEFRFLPCGTRAAIRHSWGKICRVMKA